MQILIETVLSDLYLKGGYLFLYFITQTYAFSTKIWYQSLPSTDDEPSLNSSDTYVS